MANQPNNPSSSLQHGFVAAAQGLALPQPAPITGLETQFFKRAARSIVACLAFAQTQPTSQKLDNHPLYLQLKPLEGPVASTAAIVARETLRRTRNPRTNKLEPVNTLTGVPSADHLVRYLRTQRLHVAAVNTPAGRVLRVDVPAWKDVPAIHKKLRYYFPHLVTKVAENTEAFGPARSATLHQCVSVPAPRPGS